MPGQPAEALALKSLDAETAPLVSPLVYAHYGYSYSIPWLYDGDSIVRRVDTGLVEGFVVLGDGLARGFLDIRYSFHSRAVVEVGVIIVDPELDEVRRARVVSLLYTRALQVITHHVHHGDLRLVISTETTDHTATQRFISRIGMVPTGLLFATVPAGSHLLTPHRFGAGIRHAEPPSRRRQGHRRAEVLSVHPIQYELSPYAVHLPDPFANLLRRIYGRLDVPSEFRPAHPPAEHTEIEIVHNVSRGIAIIDVMHLGADAPDRLVERLNHFVAGHVPSVQVFLPISDGDPTAAVGALLNAGCFFGGLIPRFKGSDRLVLQHATDLDPSLSDAHLADDIPRDLLAMVRSGAWR